MEAKIESDIKLLKDIVSSIKQAKVVLTIVNIEMTFNEYNSLAEIMNDLSNFTKTLEEIIDRKQNQLDKWLEEIHDEYGEYTEYKDDAE